MSKQKRQQKSHPQKLRRRTAQQQAGVPSSRRSDEQSSFERMVTLARNDSAQGLQPEAMLQLQRHYGNNFVQRLLVQRDDDEQNMSTDPSLDTTANQSTESEPEIRNVTTDYGTFAVYPDNFVGPLEVADPTGASGGWPVRESTFGQIQAAMESIAGGEAGVKIEGKKTFKAAVLMDLAWLMTQSVGYELIASIVGTGKTVTIKATKGGNTELGGADGFIKEDGKPGPGCDTTVKFNTGEWNPYGGDDEWMTRPPAIGLAHELIHAFVDMGGMTPRGKTDGTPNYELQTTGLGDYEKEIYTENKFRAAFGLPLRPRY